MLNIIYIVYDILVRIMLSRHHTRDLRGSFAAATLILLHAVQCTTVVVVVVVVVVTAATDAFSGNSFPS
jgi:hypothetical protein